MSNLRKRDIIGIVEFDFKLLEDKIGNSSPSSTLGKNENVRSHIRSSSCCVERVLERERALLSKFAHNPTVGGLRGEKVKRSTRNRLRVDSGFSEFLQTLQGRIFSLLGFYSHF